MTVHHDKPAYGKLAKTGEELSEEQILKMLKELDGGGEEENGEEKNSPPPRRRAAKKVKKD